MKSTIVYIHGWGSSPNSDTAKDLKRAFPKEEFLCPHMDYTQDPVQLRKVFDALGKKLMNKHDPIIVGSSAGGFWADYIGCVYGIKTVLVNPSLRPDVNFKKYDLPEQYLETYKKISEEIHKHPRHHMVALAGDKDDIVPLSHVKTKYKTPVMLKGEGHRLKSLSPVVAKVQQFLGNFAEHVDEDV